MDHALGYCLFSLDFNSFAYLWENYFLAWEHMILHLPRLVAYSLFHLDCGLTRPLLQPPRDFVSFCIGPFFVSSWR